LAGRAEQAASEELEADNNRTPKTQEGANIEAGANMIKKVS